MLNALIERIKRNMELHHAPGGQENRAPDDPYGAEVTHLTLTKLDDNATEEQAGNGNDHSGVPKERDDADDDAVKQAHRRHQRYQGAGHNRQQASWCHSYQ